MSSKEKKYRHELYKKAIPKNIRKKLKSKEKVLWVGKPERVPYFFIQLVLFFTGVYIAIVFGFVLMSFSTANLSSVFFISLVLLSLVIISALIVPFFKKAISYNKLLYIVTDKRLFVKGLENKTKVSVFSSKKIKAISLDSNNFVDSLFDTGSIEVRTKTNSFYLDNLRTPRDITGILRKLAKD